MAKKINSLAPIEGLSTIKKVNAAADCALDYIPLIKYLNKQYKHRHWFWHLSLKTTIAGLICEDILDMLRLSLREENYEYDFSLDYYDSDQIRLFPDFIIRKIEIDRETFVDEGFFKIHVFPDVDLNASLEEMYEATSLKRFENYLWAGVICVNFSKGNAIKQIRDYLEAGRLEQSRNFALIEPGKPLVAIVVESKQINVTTLK